MAIVRAFSAACHDLRVPGIIAIQIVAKIPSHTYAHSVLCTLLLFMNTLLNYLLSCLSVVRLGSCTDTPRTRELTTNKKRQNRSINR